MTLFPSISVVLTVYNGERYLKEAIDSILIQSFPDFELLIVDDGSTDDTARIIKTYSDTRIIPIQLPHGGLVCALNAGLQNARGTFIARMDADDRSRPHRLAVQHAFLLANPDIDIVCTDISTIDAGGRITGQQVQHGLDNDLLREALLYRRLIKPVIHPTVMMRRHVVDSLGGYRAFNNSEDHDLWLRAIDDFNFRRINQILLDYRIHNEGVSRAKGALQATNSCMSAVNYIVRKATGIDLFDDSPDLFLIVSHEMHEMLNKKALQPAFAFRAGRLKLLTGSPLAGALKIALALARYGSTALPNGTLKKIRGIVQEVSNSTITKLPSEGFSKRTTSELYNSYNMNCIDPCYKI